MCQPCLSYFSPVVFLHLTLSLLWVLPWHTQLLLNSSRVDPLKHPAALATSSSSSASSLNDLALLRPPSESASNLNGSKWRPPACLPSTAASPKRCSFQLQASSHFRCEQKVLDSSNPAPPTAHSPEWCCNFHQHSSCVRLGEFLVILSYLVWYRWAFRCVHSRARLTPQEQEDSDSQNELHIERQSKLFI